MSDAEMPRLPRADGKPEETPASPPLSEQELRVLSAASDDIALVLDATGRCLKATATAAAFFARPLDGLTGRSLDELLPEADAYLWRGVITYALHKRDTVVHEYSIGETAAKRSYLARVHPFPDGERVVWLARDITAHRVADSALAQRYEHERTLGRLSKRFINIAPDHIDSAIDVALAEMGAAFKVDRSYIYQLTDDGSCMVNSHGWSRPGLASRLGYRKLIPCSRFPWLIEQLRADRVISFAHLDELPHAASQERATFAERSVGAIVVVPVIFSGALKGFIGFDSLEEGRQWSPEQIGFLRSAGEVFAGTLQRKGSEEKIFQLAYYDELTGLPNRTRLLKLLREQVQSGGATPMTMAVIDLDESSTLNDLLGHDVGDQLLQAVSRRLSAEVTGKDAILGRWGADEFLVTTTGATTEPLGDALRARLSEPFMIAGQELRISCCIGWAQHPNDAQDIDELVRCAEMALHQAKQQGPDCVRRYTPQLRESASKRSVLRARLRRAVEHGELSLHYQPLVDAADERVVGAEALLRWTDSELGPIGPDQFIPIAEESGLIGSIGDWVLEHASAELEHWPRLDGRTPRVSVNVSGLQLLDGGLGGSLARSLLQHDLAASQLELEITESALMERGQAGLPILQRLRELGIGIAVDDFGTGYSSLSKLKLMPVTAIKIDRSFIKDIFTDNNDRAIVIAIIAMAKQLQLKVVAEGVETAEQLAFLRTNGCDLIQGYIYSRPVPSADFRRLWAQERLPLRSA